MVRVASLPEYGCNKIIAHTGKYVGICVKISKRGGRHIIRQDGDALNLINLLSCKKHHGQNRFVYYKNLTMRVIRSDLGWAFNLVLHNWLVVLALKIEQVLEVFIDSTSISGWVANADGLEYLFGPIIRNNPFFNELLVDSTDLGGLWLYRNGDTWALVPWDFWGCRCCLLLRGGHENTPTAPQIRRSLLGSRLGRSKGCSECPTRSGYV